MGVCASRHAIEISELEGFGQFIQYPIDVQNRNDATSVIELFRIIQRRQENRGSSDLPD